MRQLLFSLTMVLVVTVFSTSLEAAELKISQLKGGTQYWWEAEDFDDRDAAVFVLSGEPGSNVPDLQGVSGDDYIVHNTADPGTVVEGTGFLKYTVNIGKGGIYYVWTRSSWGRAPSSRDHNSFYVQVNGKPAIAQFARHFNTLGDANWPEGLDELNPWTWIGDSAQPQALQGSPGAGLSNGLAMEFVAGENTVMLYHREGGVNNKTLCTDVLMISTVDFAPTDEDHRNASLAVESEGKLSTTWARLKL